MTIESLAERFEQINEEFKLWVETDFKELSDKVQGLVESSESLLGDTIELGKLISQLVELTDKMRGGCGIIK